MFILIFNYRRVNTYFSKLAGCGLDGWSRMSSDAVSEPDVATCVINNGILLLAKQPQLNANCSQRG